jgi:hypothetical protein
LSCITYQKEILKQRKQNFIYLDNLVKQFNIQNARQITCTKAFHAINKQKAAQSFLKQKWQKIIELILLFLEKEKKDKIYCFLPGFSPEITLLSAGSTPTT